jgi:hypothetical protein
VSVITNVLQQQLLDALDKWSKDQSTEQIELLASFTEPILAAVAAFTMLESKHMRQYPDAIRTRDKIMTRLSQFITAKDTRGRFAAISVMLHDAMELLQQAVGVANLVQGGEIKRTAEHIDEAIRYLQILVDDNSQLVHLERYCDCCCHTAPSVSASCCALSAKSFVL